jgi:SH3-like domain-containing protein
MLRTGLAFLFAASLSAPALAQGCDTFSGLATPRFVTLKSDDAIGRTGPSREHPAQWRYRRAGLPVLIVAETPLWRRVEDPDGAQVWMHHALLTGRRSVIARTETDLRARADRDAALIARIETGAILSLERCRAGWCRLSADGRRGWAEAGAFWGVYADEAGASGALEGAQDPCYRSLPEPAALAARDATAPDGPAR